MSNQSETAEGLSTCCSRYESQTTLLTSSCLASSTFTLASDKSYKIVTNTIHTSTVLFSGTKSTHDTVLHCTTLTCYQPMNHPR